MKKELAAGWLRLATVLFKRVNLLLVARKAAEAEAECDAALAAYRGPFADPDEGAGFGISDGVRVSRSKLLMIRGAARSQLPGRFAEGTADLTKVSSFRRT